MKINFSNIWDILFPKKCIYCHRSGQYLCEDCFSLISINKNSFCSLCNRRTKNYQNCFKHQDKNLDFLHFATFYKQPLIKRVIKYYRQSPFIKELSIPLTRLIIAHFYLIYQPVNLKNILLVPFPVSRSQEKFIGYSPHREITHHLATALDLKEKDLINISSPKNFTIKQPHLIKNKRIVLIKLVYQPEESIELLAKTLKDYHAQSVSLWAVARS